MRKPFLIFITLVALVAVPYGLFAQSTDLTAQRRAELQKELDDLERQMAQTQTNIDMHYAEGESLKRDIAILDGEIKRAKLKVQTTELKIRSLAQGIVVHSRTIGTLSTKLTREQESLAQLVRKTAEIDEYTLVEAVFSSGDLSDFFQDLDTFATIQEEMHTSFAELRDTRSKTEEAKTGLESQKTDQEILRSALVLDQKEVERKEGEKRQLLAQTKGQEDMYRQLKGTQEQRAAQIRAALFPLRDTGGIQFGQAVEYANAASAKTGVRPAMILAILKQESDLGNNVGNCYVTNTPAVGDGVGKNTGTFFEGVMHPTRDVPVFMRITEALGRDWSTTQISCPQPGGYGGAMGPTQFIPSTWAMYEARLKSTLGVAATNPWNAQHAIMATGLYLSDVGAGAGTYTAEHTAAAKYYAGGNWAVSGQGYANSVMQHAAKFQQDIDFLKQN
jgi:membrane-bound lytic murein transglycosylase B